MDIVKAFSESKLEIIVDIRQIIGVENTIKLVEKCGGTQLHIPMMKRVFKSERDASIYADYESGFSYRALAVKYELASATIRDIVNAERKHSRGTAYSKEILISESEMEVISDLRQIIGIENTINLIKILGSSQIYIPKMSTVLRQEREQCIYKEYNNGVKCKEIAKKYSVSEMSVRNLVKKQLKNNKDKMNNYRRE